MITKRDVVTVGLTALATMTLTVALGWPRSLTADEKNPPAAVQIYRPVLQQENCEVAAQLVDQKQPEAPGLPIYVPAGPVPAMELTATNLGHASARLRFQASVTVFSAADRLSRVPRVIPPVYHEQFDFVLAPGESRHIPVKVTAKLATLSSATLELSGEKGMVAALSFGVPSAAVLKNAGEQRLIAARASAGSPQGPAPARR